MFARQSELQNVLCLMTCDYDYAREKDYICLFLANNVEWPH